MNKNTSNISSDSSSSCIDLGEFQAVAFSEITKWIALIEALGIIILNIILIILLAKRKKPSRMAFFVKHLAVADLCVGLLYVLPECIFDRFLNNWEKLSCLILYGYCANMTIYASTFLIVVLTIDRLFVIIRPLSASTTGSKYRYGLISVAWILAISLAIPYALHIKFICTSQGNLCGHGFPNQEAIVLAELFINVIIPVFIITLCYTWIIVIIWRRESATLGCPAQKIRYSNASTTLTGNFQKTVSSTSSVITNAKKKTIKVLLVIVIVYILSWTPINVAQVMNVFNILAPNNLYTFLHVLAPINSLMNPVVFLCFNRQMFKPEKSKTMCFTTTSQVYSDRIT